MRARLKGKYRFAKTLGAAKCASQEDEFYPRECAKHTLFLYKKVLILSEMVYNKREIKNGMTKERRWDFAMTLFMVFFVLVHWSCTI